MMGLIICEIVCGGDAAAVAAYLWGCCLAIVIIFVCIKTRSAVCAYRSLYICVIISAMVKQQWGWTTINEFMCVEYEIRTVFRVISYDGYNHIWRIIEKK